MRILRSSGGKAGLVFPIILTRALKVYTTDMVRKPARERAQQGFRARSRENTEWI
jgi:hypothetical protein